MDFSEGAEGLHLHAVIVVLNFYQLFLKSDGRPDVLRQIFCIQVERVPYPAVFLFIVGENVLFELFAKLVQELHTHALDVIK